MRNILIIGLSIITMGCASANNVKIQDPILLDSSTPNNLSDFESNPHALDVVDDITYDNLKAYISNKNYPNVTLSNLLGNLVSESQITSYSLKRMQSYYKDRLCKNIYWYNCKNNIENLQDYSGVDIESMLSFATKGVESVIGYKVSYTTQNMAGESQIVSGAILIPQSTEKLKGVVIVYHHTVLDKNNAPSNFSKDFFNQSLMLASSLSSDGYVVVMPDYLGIGEDGANVHPYIIYPEVNALSGIYMLPLVAQINDSLQYNTIKRKIPLYITGYSEGSSYALWATKILQDNHKYLSNYGYTLRRSAPIDGAYNLSHVMLDSLLKSDESRFGFQEGVIQKMIRPGLTANVLVSYNQFEYKAPESEVFTAKFAECNTGESCIYQLIQESASELKKYDKIYTKAKQAGYAQNGDSVAPLIHPNLLVDNQKLKARFESADIYNWKATVPINLITLQNDSVVSELNSYTTFVAMSKADSKQVNLTIVPNDNFYNAGLIPFTDMVVNHSGFTPYGYMIARKYFDEDDGQ